MKNIKRIYVYVTNKQLESIKNSAVEEGYLSLSSFLRDLALYKNTLFKEKFFEMHRKVMSSE